MKLHHVTFGPRPKEGGAPTLVLLHGYGADELDLVPLATELDRDFPVVSLQAPLSLGGGMRAWYMLQQSAEGFLIDEREVRFADALVAEAIEELSGERGKLILLGFSQGACMAMRAALARPESVDALVSLSGVPARTEAADRAPVERTRGLRAFVAHGTHDPLLPIRTASEVRQELQAAGLAVRFRTYPMGHHIVPDEVAELRAWLREIRGQPASGQA